MNIFQKMRLTGPFDVQGGEQCIHISKWVIARIAGADIGTSAWTRRVGAGAGNQQQKV